MTSQSDNTSKDQAVDEQYQAITDICAENGDVTKPMVDKLHAFFQAECNRARADEVNALKGLAVAVGDLNYYRKAVPVEAFEARLAELQQIMKEPKS